MAIEEPRGPVASSIPVCGIGASAGGVEALKAFFSAVPQDLGMAYVVIVHLAPNRKSELPNIIARCTTMHVVQVNDHRQAKLQPNWIYVIAPASKLEITDTSLGACSFERERGPRTEIDLFFCSLAEWRGDRFAIVLSGTGSDGMIGAKAVKEQGGFVLVQDPGDAVCGEMPASVIASGVADLILPASELVAGLARLARDNEKIRSRS